MPCESIRRRCSHKKTGAQVPRYARSLCLPASSRSTSAVKLIIAQARDPALVWRFYHYRRSVALAAKPNAAHHALARLCPTLITQNVDGLSSTVGHQRLLEMHGTIRTARCTVCSMKTDTFADEGIPPCPKQDCRGVLRPNVVWFGEMPEHLDEIARVLKDVDVLLVVGTSSTVRAGSLFGDLLV